MVRLHARTRAYFWACLAIVMALGAPPAAAQDAVRYPARKIDFVVAFAAGGFADTMARLVAQKLSEQTGQSVIVDNRAGAGGNTAARAVAAAEPDGHTVLVTTTASAINQSMYKKLEYAPDALVPVAISASSAESISVHPSKVAGGLADFLNVAKDREITFATAGVGSGSHLAAEYFFKALAKVKALHVPFRGGAPAVQAAMGDQVDAVATSFGVTGLVTEGKLKGLAVASARRSPAMPMVPTFAESGFAFEAESWVGFFVPAKTDAAIVAKLNAAINAIVSATAEREKLEKVGFQIAPRDVAQTQQYMKAEVEKWGTMVRTLGVYVE
jgi:tripartite-type tricarboxylate transporter receptor subunit TctC